MGESSEKKSKTFKGYSSKNKKMYTTDCVDVNLCDFCVLAEKDYYIDKTYLISDIFDEDKNLKIMMTAPPGSGKTTILSMVKAFLEIEVDENGSILDKQISKKKNFFQKNLLTITNRQDLFDNHFAKYPVLNISFENLTGIYSVQALLEKLNFVLDGLLRLHSYLNDSDKLSESEKQTLRVCRKLVSIGNNSGDEIADTFAFLKHCLFEHFDKRKVFIFIDDCDTPIFNSRHNIKTIKIEEKIFEIMYKILSTLIDDDEECLKGCLIAGIYEVDYQKYIPEPSSTTTFRKITFQDCCTNPPYFGLVESQVNLILTRHNIDNETIKSIKTFYGGYYNKQGIKSYSQWSILSYLQYKLLKSYWLKSNRVDSGVEAIDVLYALENLMLNIPYKIKYKKLIANLDYKNRGFFDYLLHLGYLSFNPVERGNIHLKTPSQNIRSRISAEEVDIFSTSTKEIMTCASIIYKIKNTTENRTYRQLIVALKQTFNAYNTDLLIAHDEYFFLILFIIAIKLKWLIGATYLLTRPSFDSIILRNTKTAISFIVCCNYHCPLRGLQKILEAQHIQYFLNSLDLVEQKISIAININTATELRVSLAVLSGRDLEDARLIAL